MRTYDVKIRIGHQKFHYSALGRNPCDIICQALDVYGVKARIVVKCRHTNRYNSPRTN